LNKENPTCIIARINEYYFISFNIRLKVKFLPKGLNQTQKSMIEVDFVRILICLEMRDNEALSSD